MPLTTPPTRRALPSPRRLIEAGTVGAALFVAVFTILTAARADYDPVRHFISILSLGDGGSAQVVNFIVGGVLVAGLGVGLAQRWREGPGARAIPRLVTLTGVALVGCGVFIPDPSLGYPPGTPDQLITPLTWHGAIHYASATVILLAMTAAILIAIRRALVLRQRGLVLASIAAAVFAVLGCGAAIALGGRPPAELVGLLERIGVFAGWGWLVLVGLLELRAEVASG